MKLNSLIPKPSGRHVTLRIPLKRENITKIQLYPHRGIISFEYNKTIKFPFYACENIFIHNIKTRELRAIFYLPDCCYNSPSILGLCTDEMLECKVLLNKKERRILSSALEET